MMSVRVVYLRGNETNVMDPRTSAHVSFPLMLCMSMSMSVRRMHVTSRTGGCAGGVTRRLLTWPPVIHVRST